MNSLGIYFGPKVISIIETKGRKLLNNISLPVSSFLDNELEEKVPDTLKIVALFKDELRRSKIEAKEVALAFSGKDLIIRTFDMPLLPGKELQTAVGFEIKKYIPFKVEDLVADFQIRQDSRSKKNIVLFVGIKKDVLDKYLSIFSQLNIKISAIEYPGFSLLRLLKLTGLGTKGIIGMVNVDFKEEDEVNFVVLENGDPLFSRDITLTSEAEGLAKSEGGTLDSETILEKLKTEIRVSLDYYNRKFPDKKIKKLFFISLQNYHAELEEFMKEMGVPLQFVDIAKSLDKSITLSSSLSKGYSSSLYKTIRTGIKINLLAAKARMKSLEEKVSSGPLPAISLANLLNGLRVDLRIIIAGLLICCGILAYSFYKRVPLQKELKDTVARQPQVSTVKPETSYDNLMAISAAYAGKIKNLDELMKKQVYLTEPLDTIPRILPEGIWLEDFNFQSSAGRRELVLMGLAYLKDVDKEFEVVNNFVSTLKENPVFAKYFREITLVSLNQEPLAKEGESLTRFKISCQGY